MSDPRGANDGSEYARGVAAGKRAAVQEIARALDMIARDVERQLAAPPTTVTAAPATSAPQAGDPPPRKAPPILGVGVDRARLERFLRVTSDDAKGTVATSPAPPPVAPETPVRAPEPAPPPSAAASPAPRGHRAVADYLRQRASQWWERACDVEHSVAVRAEARAIAGELFEIAEAVARGDV